MTTSKLPLYSLQFEYRSNTYEKNLLKLTDLIKTTQENSLVVAPELSLTHFSFDFMQKAADFGKEALKEIVKLSENRIIAFSLTEKIGNKFYNNAKIIYKKEVIHTQAKYKLFKFGFEDKYFVPGREEDIKIVEINNLKIAILICFEIRFIDLWKKIQGADIILIPALWGKLRKEQLEAITKAMGIINQAFIVLANSANLDMAKSSGIITPFGKEIRDDSSEIISHNADLNEIRKMRRYMDIGLK